MASIQRIKSPITGAVSYKAQVRVKGRPSQTDTFPNRKEALAWAADIETAIRHNKRHPHLMGGKKAFAAVAERYLKEVVNDAKDLDARKMHLDWFCEQWPGLTLGELTPDKIAEARDKLAAGTYSRGKDELNKDGTVKRKAREFKRSGATVNRYLATLSHMMSVAKKEWRLVDSNPVADITRKREGRGRTRFLSDTERDKLLEACKASSWPQLHALVILAITTGARRGELVNLRWDAIDLKAGTALVTETKNGEPRTLPLVGKALEVVRELKLQGSARSDYVFPHANGMPEPYKNFDHRWNDAMKAAGITGFRFHDLRHTCASYLAANGASLLEIADVLGHKTLAMVRRYSHLTQSHKASVVERMAKAQGL